MPSSQAPAAERRNDRMMVTNEPPKLKTTLTTPPKQATNPLQFVKVGPCSLYRSAHDQLTKVEEVKKVKQEVREEAEDWQSNLDNWKSSRRKRQEHIIERVVEVKKLELEEHDRQRRRSKTFSEMMEERGSRGRKLSMSLAMYHEEDSNDLSDLGIGTSSGKSSISGDTHDDSQSVLSDRDSEIDKNHSDLDNTMIENGNNISSPVVLTVAESSPVVAMEKPEELPSKSSFGNGFHSDDQEQREYDSGTTATVSSPEPEEYTYEGAIRGYVSRVAQNIPRRSLAMSLETQLDKSSSKINIFDDKTSSLDEKVPVVKIDIHKRREMFEKASENNNDNKLNGSLNRSSGDFTKTISIKERLSCLEKQKNDDEMLNDKNKKSIINRLPGDMSSIRERLTNLEKKASDRENKISRKSNIDDYVEPIIPLRERLSTLEKYSSPPSDESSSSSSSILRTSIEANDADKKPIDKQLLRFNNNSSNNHENSTPSERSSSPDSEYRASRTAFHRSLDSLDADASSGPDTFERVQSLEELDYVRRYTGSVSSAEILNDTDREDSGIHTADVSCSVSQADEPVDEDIVQDNRKATTAESQTETKRIEQIDSDVPLAVITEESIVIGGGSSADKEMDELLVELPVESSSASSVEHEEVPRVCELTVDTRAATELPASHLDKNTDTSMEIIISKREHKSLEDEMNLLAFDQPTLQQNSIKFIEPLSPMSKQIPQFNMTSDEEIVTGLAFPLGPPSSVEPPKEKPPPPPTDFSDEENQPIEPLKRLNSTRRIKKELRTRRSDFLGIEGINDDDLEFSLVKPPNMAAILAEERRIEQLHRRSYDTDSNYEQDSSHERDSGVELGHAEDWVKQPVSPDMSQHSRQSSEPFGASVTSSEEDEITKKEREIIEVLEKEEQWRYGNDREQNSDIGEKLAHKLRKLEEEKMQLERERAHEQQQQHQQDETMRMNDENMRMQDNTEEILQQQQQQQQQKQEMTVQQMMEGDEIKMREEEQLRVKTEMLEKDRRSVDIRKSMEKQLREQEKTVLTAVQYNHEDDYASGEVLRVERELLQLEQEELKRQRTNLAYREQKQQQLAEQLQEQWQSLQDVAHASPNNSHATYQNISVLNYRSSMPNLQLQEHGQRRRPPPPPIPPAKPLRLVDQRQRDVTIRNSRIPSADNIPQQVETVSLRHSVSVSTLGNNYGGQQQQMTKQTLQALSAVPRTRIVKGDQWVQRRKSDGPRAAQDLNYQHWLIQEAEQRRINEKNQRVPARKSQQHVTGTSVPYIATPTRSDGKPLPDSIIQTLTQRMQNRAQERLPPPIRRRLEHSVSHEQLSMAHNQQPQHVAMIHQKVHQLSNSASIDSQEKLLSVSGTKKCSHCGDELGRGAAMIIESLRLFYHMKCFKCCVCHTRLGDGLMGTDVRVRNHKLHCHNCYSSDDGVKFSCV